MTQTSTTPTLQLLTFEDLVELAEQRRHAARAPDKIAGWDRLLGVARSLAGTGNSDNDIATGRTWSLVKLRVTATRVSVTECRTWSSTRRPASP